jgi:hypothetical protein
MGFTKPGYNKYQTGGLQHLLASQIRAEVGRDTFDHFFKFSVVRNPWDKVVSQFSYMRRRPDLRELIGMSEGGSLKEYLRLIQGVEHVQWCEQWRFVTGEPGQIIVDFIGRFENFEADARLALAKVNIACDELPHRNRSLRSHYTSYYDAESRETVRKLYQRDIDLFEYTFG